MNVVGIHVGHDSSAALVSDGRILADVAEERFRRIKHHAGIPSRAIAYCVHLAEIYGKTIDAVAIASTQAIAQLSQWLGTEHARSLTAERARRLTATAIQPPLYLRATGLPPHAQVIHVGHHLAHAASAYFTSGCQQKQLLVTMDGAGDGRSTCIWRGEHGAIEPLLELGDHASLGWFYGGVTEALGWWHGDGEGKTMGLAAFGQDDRCRGVLSGFHPEFRDGVLASAHDYGRPAYWAENGALHWHMREAEQIHGLIAQHGREHIAAEAQRVLEEQVAALVLPWLDKERVDAIACAGGLFLNVKLNQGLWESGRLARQHVFPNAGDAGLAVGAALYADVSANPRIAIPELDSMYCGPSFDDAAIEECLRTRGLRYRRSDDPADEAAQALAAGKIVGWFQGRMESGPRALGNRSILMSARDAAHRATLNARVKFREAFRPFCPSLIDERRDRYLYGARAAEFMTTSFRATPAAIERAPAAVHVDGTTRPQTVRREANPLFWRLLDRFGELTGEPIVLNTSFNVAGEPVVNTPSDAVRCFFDTGLDCLIMSGFVLTK